MTETLMRHLNAYWLEITLQKKKWSLLWQTMTRIQPWQQLEVPIPRLQWWWRLHRTKNQLLFHTISSVNKHDNMFFLNILTILSDHKLNLLNLQQNITVLRAIVYAKLIFVVRKLCQQVQLNLALMRKNEESWNQRFCI